MCGASVAGSEHVRRGLGCDDAFSYGHVGDFIVAAVADGAGSVSGTSAWGSYTACQAVLELAMDPDFIGKFKVASASDADAIMRWLFLGARAKVTNQAETMDLPVALLSTTLCVAIAVPNLLVMGQIGDGIIALESDDGIGTHLIEEKDEYANATWFIQSDEAFEKSFRAAGYLGATAFALSTDGMSYKITDIGTGQPFEPFFKGAWQKVRTGASGADFSSLLRGIEDDQTGDDKTMVLAAMNWVDDAYYPAAQPVIRIEVSSPPPPPVPGREPRDEALRAPRPPEADVAPVPQPRLPAGEAPSEAQPSADEDTAPVSHRRRWTRRAKDQAAASSRLPKSSR